MTDKTHADDGGDKEQHQCGEVQEDDSQQQEQHLSSRSGCSRKTSRLRAELESKGCVAPPP